MSKTYQIQVVIAEIEPKIWRRLLVSSDTLLVDLHRILQTSFGWTNSHLHLFDNGLSTYSPMEFEVEETENSRIVKLSTILKRENFKVIYEYDFGDSWSHEILLERIIEKDAEGQIPRCIAGERNSPPENCGGTTGYQELLKTISNKKHPDYKNMMQWLGGKFDPEGFDIEKINKKLKRKKIMRLS